MLPDWAPTQPLQWFSGAVTACLCFWRSALTSAPLMWQWKVRPAIGQRAGLLTLPFLFFFFSLLLFCVCHTDPVLNLRMVEHHVDTRTTTQELPPFFPAIVRGEGWFTITPCLSVMSYFLPGPPLFFSSWRKTKQSEAANRKPLLQLSNNVRMAFTFIP